MSVAMGKWGERPHWRFDAVYLGGDQHGDWLGLPAGTVFTRPGSEYVAPVDQVSLVPRTATSSLAGWMATFHARGGPVAIYADVTTPPRWDNVTVRATDLDLDVVRLPDGAVSVWDEDEFDAHSAAWGYPADVVAAARRTCTELHEAVLAAVPPFDPDTPASWLASGHIL